MIPDEVALVFTAGIAIGIWAHPTPDGRFYVAFEIPLLRFELFWGEVKAAA